MNPVEQKAHTRRTDELADAIERITNAMIERCTHIEQTCRQIISDETTARLNLAREQRSYVDNEDRKLGRCCQERWDFINATTKRLADQQVAFESRGFWSRVQWLLTGR